MKNNKPKILFIYPRKGLYLLTKCNNCKYTYQCKNCDSNLVTYKKWEKNLELVCHQCQSYYSYPVNCQNCGQEDFSSVLEGIDRLSEIIEQEVNQKVIRLDNKKFLYSKYINESIFVTTRIYDPSINYSDFSKVIFVSSENLLSSPDYLVQEDTTKQLTEVLLDCSDKTQVIFDTSSPESELFTDLSKLSNMGKKDLLDWFIKFLKQESEIRKQYKFPPFNNLILITVQEKNKDKAWDLINGTKNIISKNQKEKYPDITISSPYPARFLRRKNYYSYHFLIKYPKQYPKFFQLKRDLINETKRQNLQIRLNPKHLF